MLLVIMNGMAKKNNRVKLKCPGMPAKRQSSFDDILQYAADISSSHRSLEARDCFELAVELAKDDKERNIALYNLAVVQKDLHRPRCPILLNEFTSRQSHASVPPF